MPTRVHRQRAISSKHKQPPVIAKRPNERSRLIVAVQPGQAELACPDIDLGARVRRDQNGNPSNTANPIREQTQTLQLIGRFEERTYAIVFCLFRVPLQARVAPTRSRLFRTCYRHWHRRMTVGQNLFKTAPSFSQAATVCFQLKQLL